MSTVAISSRSLILSGWLRDVYELSTVAVPISKSYLQSLCRFLWVIYSRCADFYELSTVAVPISMSYLQSLCRFLRVIYSRCADSIKTWRVFMMHLPNKSHASNDVVNSSDISSCGCSKEATSLLLCCVTGFGKQLTFWTVKDHMASIC